MYKGPGDVILGYIAIEVEFGGVMSWPRLSIVQILVLKAGFSFIVIIVVKKILKYISVYHRAILIAVVYLIARPATESVAYSI